MVVSQQNWTSPHIEPGSSRDRHGRIFYLGENVYRYLSETALNHWNLLSQSKFFPEALASGKVVQTMLLSESESQEIGLDNQWTGILKHQRIPFISYPYEWSFGMLKDAALLQLELLIQSLEESFILKDSSAYNFQWIGARPVFIDTPSFEKLESGDSWVGYRQFCQLFLYPLMLQSYKDVPFQQWLRGNIDGVTPESMSHLMSLKDTLRAGVLMHVVMQSKAQATFSETDKDLNQVLKSVGFNRDLILANVKGLQKLVKSLNWGRQQSEWADYTQTHNYTADDHQQKMTFVREVTHERPWNLVWDLGCNTGQFSRIASENARYVIAMDADHLAVERLYQALKQEGNTQILPLVGNVADPSPNWGWQGQERKSLELRGKPDLVLALAVIHHLVISANIPIRDLMQWFRGLDTALVIEFVTKEDPMVQKLLRNKKDQYTDYEVDYFENCLAEGFQIERTLTLGSGTRILYYLTPRG